MADSLKKRQIDALKCMLNFNTPYSESEIPQWKVLIYDQIGRDIISPLLTIKELRALGVTLHLLIDSKREAIPDVPAVYFVYPSPDNINTMCKDFENNTYESYYFNFISSISRESLETIAKSALLEDCVKRVTRVFDQYTNFISLESDLITLRSPAKQDAPFFYALNRSHTTESDIEVSINELVDGLFSVFATLGNVPIIRALKGQAAELVANKLDNRLRDCLRDSRASLFVTDQASSTNLFQRPLLVLVDRDFDLASPLRHTMHYQCLIDDIFKIKLNRIKLEPATSSNSDQSSDQLQRKSEPQQYDLASISDQLWANYRASPFPDVAEAIQEEVKVLRQHEKHVGELKSSMGGGSTSSDLMTTTSNDDFSLDDNTAKLSSAMNTLPDLLKRKPLLDMHTNIATRLANIIQQRQLHVLTAEEDKLAQHLESDLTTLIKDPQVGSLTDKLRLLLFTGLLKDPSSSSTSTNPSSAPSINSSPTDFALSNQLFASLMQTFRDEVARQEAADFDSSALAYVQRLRGMTSNAGLQAGGGGGNSATVDNHYHNHQQDGFSGGQRVLNMLVSRGSAMLRQLTTKGSYLPLTNIVSQLMENKIKNDSDDYLYLDPRTYRRADSNVPRYKQPFTDCFVFVIGGGSYVEYQNLTDWARSSTGTQAGLSLLNGGGGNMGGDQVTDHQQSVGAFSSAAKRRVVYGCSDLVNPTEFLQQLAQLGRE